MKTKEKIFWIVGVPALAFIIIGAGGVGFAAAYEGKVLPGVFISEVWIGGLNEEEARARIEAEANTILSSNVELVLNDEVLADARLSELGVQIPASLRADQALKFGRTGFGVERFMHFVRGITRAKLPFDPVVDTDMLETFLVKHVTEYVHEPQSASFRVQENGSFELVPSVTGIGVDYEKIVEDLKQASVTSLSRIPVVFTEIRPEIVTVEAERMRHRVEDVQADTISLQVQEAVYKVPPKEFVSWIILEKREGEIFVTADAERVSAYITEHIAPIVDREPQNARFELTNERVTIFQQPQDGTKLDVDLAVSSIRNAVESRIPQVKLVITVEKPEITTTSDLERLGISERIGRGESNFAGSPANRIHNIEVGTSRFHGLLIPPGEVFAFNKNLGPVTGEMGYKEELVILQNVTTPLYGGGLCQVSTTAFRAAVYSGMEIVERRPHSYPVSYYGTPGFDATIYPNQRTWRDGVDLKFRNNTDNYILIQAWIEGTKNIFEFWGTDDGREVIVEGPYPYNRNPDGSVRATLTQQVNKNEETLSEKVFHSSYQSPDLFPQVRAANLEQGTWEDTVDESNGDPEE